MGRWSTFAIVAVACAGCASTSTPVPTPATPATTPGTTQATTQATSPGTTTPSLATRIDDWKLRAGEHFSDSADALEGVSRASATEDEAGLLTACQQLHDANSIGLQEDLPTPDRRLTDELQKMIDDMNVAAHGCLRFVLGRDVRETDIYQEYLARAVDHLQRAKVILSELES